MSPRAIGATLAVAAAMSVGCGQRQTGTADAAALVPPAVDIGPDAVEVAFRLVLPAVRGGDVWTAGPIDPQGIWALGDDAEAAEVADEEAYFAFTFGAAADCDPGRPAALVFTPGEARLHPVFAAEDVGCIGGDVPLTVVVGVVADEVPKGDFQVWLNGEEPPTALADGAGQVVAGRLTSPDPDAQAFPELPHDGDLAVGETRIGYDRSTHCGLGLTFESINGRQWQAAEPAAGDWLPSEWRPLVRSGEQIDLVFELVAPDQLEIRALGSDRVVRYEPMAADEVVGCD